MQNNATAPLPVSLFCLDGDAAPQGIIEALDALADQPDRLLERMPELVASCLEAATDDQRDARVARICRRDELQQEIAAPAVGAILFLLERAAAMNLDRVRFESDLVSAHTPAPLVPAFIELFDAVIGELRANIARASIAAHGPVVTGIEWRIDTVGSSSRGRQLDVPVALVTFAYQNGDRSDRFTMQMLPDAVNELRAICDQLLSR